MRRVTEPVLGTLGMRRKHILDGTAEIEQIAAAMLEQDVQQK